METLKYVCNFNANFFVNETQMNNILIGGS